MNEKIILYTTDCSKCRMLEHRLETSKTEFTKIEDIEEMEKLGIMESPMLKVGDELLNFSDALRWILTRK